MVHHAVRGLGMVLVVLLAGVSLAGAQDLKFQTTVDFALNKRVALEGKAGEVEIRGVEFIPGKAGSGGIKGAFDSGDTEMQAGIVTRLECATTSETKWKLDILVEFLDSEGELIDRTMSSESLKAEAKILEVSHVTLKYVVSKIAQARITVTGTGKL